MAAAAEPFAVPTAWDGMAGFQDSSIPGCVQLRYDFRNYGKPEVELRRLPSRTALTVIITVQDNDKGSSRQRQGDRGMNKPSNPYRPATGTHGPSNAFISAHRGLHGIDLSSSNPPPLPGPKRDGRDVMSVVPWSRCRISIHPPRLSSTTRYTSHRCWTM